MLGGAGRGEPADLVGASVIVDQTGADMRQLLSKYRYLVTVDELRPDPTGQN
jgi:hypothetical protein